MFTVKPILREFIDERRVSSCVWRLIYEDFFCFLKIYRFRFHWIFYENRIVGIDRLSDFNRQQRNGIMAIVDLGVYYVSTPLKLEKSNSMNFQRSIATSVCNRNARKVSTTTIKITVNRTLCDVNNANPITVAAPPESARRITQWTIMDNASIELILKCLCQN